MCAEKLRALIKIKTEVAETVLSLYIFIVNC